RLYRGPGGRVEDARAVHAREEPARGHVAAADAASRQPDGNVDDDGGAAEAGQAEEVRQVVHQGEVHGRRAVAIDTGHHPSATATVDAEKEHDPPTATSLRRTTPMPAPLLGRPMDVPLHAGRGETGR